MNKVVVLLLVAVPFFSFAGSNKTIQSFNKAKKLLEREVYFDHRKTIYCTAEFDAKKLVFPPAGFVSKTHKKRSKKVEWEHVVPAENFGRTFVEWREGSDQCINRKGKQFKGRPCASKINTEYRFMQSDMYNLFPAIGSVNAKRSNYNFVASVDSENSFGSCAMRIESRKAEPPEISRGRIARTYLYMDSTYSRYRMGRAQKQLMDAWDKLYPVTKWECLRAERIKKAQGNTNKIMASRCEKV